MILLFYQINEANSINAVKFRPQSIIILGLATLASH